MIGLEHFPERVPVKSNHALRHAREGEGFAELSIDDSLGEQIR